MMNSAFLKEEKHISQKNLKKTRQILKKNLKELGLPEERSKFHI